MITCVVLYIGARSCRQARLWFLGFSEEGSGIDGREGTVRSNDGWIHLRSVKLRSLKFLG